MKIRGLFFGAVVVFSLALPKTGRLFAQTLSQGNITVDQRLAELEQEIRILKRQQELQNEDKVKNEKKIFEQNLKGVVGDYKWLKDLKFAGDFRLRYEGVQNRESSVDRNRFRYRLRFGFEKKFSDELKVGFRLVSAPSEFISPTRNSTDTTLDTQFAFKDVSIDRAFASYTPNWAKVGPVKGLEVSGGKFQNPFEEGTSEIIWDRDITPEGAYEKIDLGLFDNRGVTADLSLLAGQLVVAEGSGQGGDSELWAYQSGVNFKFKEVTDNPIETKHYVSFYDYSDFVNSGNFGTAGGNFTNGGNLAANNFRILDIYNEIGFEVLGLPKSGIYFDWAKNIAESAPSRAVGGGEDTAWAAGLTVGKAKKKGSWELGYKYLSIEANSTPSLFSDSTFGGSNRRGSVLSAAYAMTDYLSLRGSAYYTNAITNGNPAIGNSQRDLYQVDLLWKF